MSEDQSIENRSSARRKPVHPQTRRTASLNLDNRKYSLATVVLVFGWAVILIELPLALAAQSIQPVIVEYVEKADGKFAVSNDTLVPMAIVIEPKSFSIDSDGKGIFRPLDDSIHVKLSATSFRLEPKQSFYVFYKANADRLPAWFSIYASFAPIQPHEGMTVRVMLPHTVYLYQRKPISKDSIHMSEVSYRTKDASLTCDVENRGPSLVRVQEVRAVTGKKTVVSAGFPLLPGSSRHLSIDWTEKGEPDFLLLRFPHFDVKEPLKTRDP